jgi:hypothetical protein
VRCRRIDGENIVTAGDVLHVRKATDCVQVVLRAAKFGECRPDAGAPTPPARPYIVASAAVPTDDPSWRLDRPFAVHEARRQMNRT